MEKIMIKHNEMLQLLQQLIEKVDFKIEDSTAPESWQGKTALEVLNCQYYSYKHRPDTALESEKLLQAKSGITGNSKSFCHFSIAPQGVQRAYNKDSDVVTVTADLEYWIQPEKQYLVEECIERLSVASCGKRLQVQLGKEARRVLLTFSNVVASEIEECTAFGEMVVLSISVTFIFTEAVYSKSDYSIAFYQGKTDSDIESVIRGIVPFSDGDLTEEKNWIEVPFVSLQWQNSSTQKALPYINDVQLTSTINLSSSKVLALAFDGYMYNVVVEKLCKNTLQGNCSKLFTKEPESEIDINEQYFIRLTRGEEKYYYNCILQEHKIVAADEPNNETHTLLFTLNAKERSVL